MIFHKKAHKSETSYRMFRSYSFQRYLYSEPLSFDELEAVAKQTPATKTQKIHKASTGKLPALRSFPDIHKVSVFARYLDKLLMRSALNHPTVVHNKDLVRLLDRCQTMCDRHDRLAFCQL